MVFNCILFLFCWYIPLLLNYANGIVSETGTIISRKLKVELTEELVENRNWNWNDLRTGIGITSELELK